MNKIEQFNKFLEDNGCKDSYYSEMGYYELEDFDAEDWVDSFFVWDNSPEGHNYWSDLNVSWRNYLHGTSEE